MEYRLRPWVSWNFLQNNNYQAVMKMEWIHLLNCLIIVVLQKTLWNPGSQSIVHELNIYMYLIYTYIYVYICTRDEVGVFCSSSRLGQVGWRRKLMHNHHHYHHRRVISTDIPDPLSPPLPIVHRFRQVLRTTPRIHTEVVYKGSSRSPYFCSATWRGP